MALRVRSFMCRGLPDRGPMLYLLPRISGCFRASRGKEAALPVLWHPGHCTKSSMPAANLKRFHHRFSVGGYRDIVAGSITALPQALQVSIEPCHKTRRFSQGSVAMFVFTIPFRMVFRQHLDAFSQPAWQARIECNGMFGRRRNSDLSI